METLSLLPHLSLADLTSEVKFHEVRPTTMFERQVLVSELETNHISYLDVGFEVSCLPPRLLPWLDLFGTIVTEIGTSRLDYRQFAKEVATCTGSFSHSLNTYSHKGVQDSTRPVLWLHLKCLPDYLERALHLVAEVLSDLSLENRARIREICGREFAWAEHSAQSEGYNLAASRVFSHLSLAGQYSEQFNGITAYLAIKDLVLHYDEREEEFLAALREIAATLFNRHNLILAVTADAREIEHLEKVGDCLLEPLSTRPVSRQPLPASGHPDHEAFITSSEVVYAVQGGNLLAGGEGYTGNFEVLKTYLARDYLWNTVRQMGGAYGCFIQFSQITGNLAFISYRDPQVKKTFEAYRGVPDVVASLDIPDKVLHQLIIGTYGNFDPLQSAAAKGATARNEYLSGIDAAFKQQRLEEILATTVDGMRRYASSFAAMANNSYRSAIGNRSKIENDRELFNQLTDL